MKYFKRLNMWKNYNSNNTFNPETFEAHSYQWWCFVKKIKGKIVFNDYYYSPTTCTHQREMISLLDQLGIKIDCFVEAPKGLDEISWSQGHYKDLIHRVELQKNKPKTHKKKNAERDKKIAFYKTKIKLVERLIKEN